MVHSWCFTVCFGGVFMSLAASLFFLRNRDIQMAPDKTVPLPRTAVSETNIELSTQLNGWTLGRVCWVHVSDPIWTDCLLTLTSCSMLLPAIREGENSSELLEKTLLKLRQDQKGSLLKSEWLRFYTIPHNFTQYQCLSFQTVIQKFPSFFLLFSLIHSESLLRYCVVWNTNARNCLNAQAVLQVLLTHLPPEELLQYQGARSHLEGLIPYTG